MSLHIFSRRIVRYKRTNSGRRSVRAVRSGARTARGRWPGGRLSVTGLVLAGGRGVRTGNRDKGLIAYRGRPAVVSALDWLAPWCDATVISANRHASRYARLGANLLVADPPPAWRGPLAGISACLDAIDTRALLICPCDVAPPPANLPGRLLRTLLLDARADAVVAHDPERLQPLVAALRGDLGPGLRRYLDLGGRSVRGWLDTLDVVEVRTATAIGNRNR